MRNKYLSSLMALGLMVAASPSRAEDPAIVMYWELPSIGVGFHDSVNHCVSPTIGATNTWNAIGADFYFWTETIASHPRVSQQTPEFNKKNVTFETKDILGDVDALMETERTRDGATGNIINADVYVRTSLSDQGNSTPGTYICSVSTTVPANRYDWQTGAFHELGHVLGFKDITEPPCAMHRYQSIGQIKRGPCPAEKQEFLDVYGLPFKILSLENVAGPQGVNIPARIFYQGVPTFPVTRTTVNTSCPSGWSCGPYNGTYTSSTPSPLTFNFRCTNVDPMPTATFGWRTTLKDASGRVTNTVEHTSTCTRPAGTKVPNRSPDQSGQPKVIITQ